MNRKIWMFPRNKRRIIPLETALFLRAMVIASGSGSTWSGDQKQQNLFAKLLEEYGLKGGGNQRDKNSGGARTYEAQLRLLGLLGNNTDGSLALTQAGAAAVDLKNLAETFIWQILKIQYPSQYSKSQNIKIDPAIKVRPFVLLLDLMQDEELNGLTDVDMMIPVVYGHNHLTYDKCKKKIIRARDNGIKSEIPDGDYIRTTKTKNSTYESRIKDIKNVANTFKNVMQGTGMIVARVVGDTTRWFIEPSIVPSLLKVKQLPFIDFDRSTPLQAQLKYGLLENSVKDTRRVLMPTRLPSLDTTSGIIYQRFLDTVDLPATQGEINKFAEQMSSELGVSYHVVLNALRPIVENATAYVNQHLIELSNGGTKKAESFEKHVAKIFEVDFGFESQWTGRKKRKDTGGYMDVFVVETGRNKCGIIDTKSTNIYDLPHQDVVKATATYIDGASELYGSRNLDLSFVAYVSHLIAPGSETRAMDIYNGKGVPVGLLSAYGLNSMRCDPHFINTPQNVTQKLSAHPVNLII